MKRIARTNAEKQESLLMIGESISHGPESIQRTVMGEMGKEDEKGLGLWAKERLLTESLCCMPISARSPGPLSQVL